MATIVDDRDGQLRDRGWLGKVVLEPRVLGPRSGEPGLPVGRRIVVEGRRGSIGERSW